MIPRFVYPRLPKAAYVPPGGLDEEGVLAALRDMYPEASNYPEFVYTEVHGPYRVKEGETLWIGVKAIGARFRLHSLLRPTNEAERDWQRVSWELLKANHPEHIAKARVLNAVDTFVLDTLEL